MADEAYDLIVMGSHGRGLISGLLTGRVAEKVVRIAPCPVLTVRKPEREFVVPDADQATIGVAQQHAFTGSGLGAKWSDPNRRSAFFGTFAY